MKRLNLKILLATGLLFALIAFTFSKESGIIGRIFPANAASEVVAVSGSDTLKTTINNGAFIFSPIKPRTYIIWIKANTPYRDTVVENVAVIDSTLTDIGEIKLQQ